MSPQAPSPEFKPQFHQTKKKKNKTFYCTLGRHGQSEEQLGTGNAGEVVSRSPAEKGHRHGWQEGRGREGGSRPNSGT
jgi:hypothetical protein